MGRAGWWPLPCSIPLLGSGCAWATWGPSGPPQPEQGRAWTPAEPGCGGDRHLRSSRLVQVPTSRLSCPARTFRGDPTLQTTGAGGRDGQHRALPEPSPQTSPSQKNSTTHNSEKSLSLNKIHGNASNTSASPSVFIPGELDKIFFPHREYLNKCLNFPLDPSPSAGDTAGSPGMSPSQWPPFQQRTAWPDPVLPCRPPRGAELTPCPAPRCHGAMPHYGPSDNGAKPAAAPCERLMPGLGQEAP